MSTVRALLCSLLAVGTWALPGCIVEPVDLSDRACPCATGFACNRILDRCCQPTTELVRDFREQWSTATTIRWTWEPIPSEEVGFMAYELWIAQSEADLTSRSGTARLFDSGVNPELGGLNLSQTASAEDLVVHTTTDELTPNTTYLAQLFAIDATGCPFASEIAVGRTTGNPLLRIPLFVDELLGSPYPADYVLVPDPAPPSMEMHWNTIGSPSCDGDPDCGENLRLISMDVPADHIMRSSFEGDRRVAMLEMTVRTTGMTHSSHSRVWLRFTDADGVCGGRCGIHFKVEPFTLRAGSPEVPMTHRLEFPLAELRYTYRSGDPSDPTCVMDRALSYEELTSVCEVNFGGKWETGTQLWIDDIVIRH
jgi:hypothetical protein